MGSSLTAVRQRQGPRVPSTDIIDETQVLTAHPTTKARNTAPLSTTGERESISLATDGPAETFDPSLPMTGEGASLIIRPPPRGWRSLSHLVRLYSTHTQKRKTQ